MYDDLKISFHNRTISFYVCFITFDWIIFGDFLLRYQIQDTYASWGDGSAHRQARTAGEATGL